VNLFRAPYGDYNSNVIKKLKDQGYYTIQWDVDSLDWKDLSSDEIIERVTSRTKNGSIILFHNAAKHTSFILNKTTHLQKHKPLEV
jgi:peptidoglycan/xylan/chitin deacetylase (PgdA/CDA1 family)